MKKNNTQNTALPIWARLTKLALYLVIVVSVFMVGIFGGAQIYVSYFDDDVRAAFNSSANRYEDVLTSPHQIAQYELLYINNSGGTQSGFFELSLTNAVGDLPQNLIESIQVLDTYPVSPNGTPENGSITNNLSSAAFFSGSNFVVRFGPQSNCIPRSQGGCADSFVTPNRRGKITIQVGLKVNASQIPSTIQGSGSFVLNGVNAAQTGWQIQSIYNKTNAILNPSVTPGVNFSGVNGVGDVFVGQNYTIVVSGIKAIDGSNLNASSGSCTTTRGGSSFTGFGISNGSCVIPISQSAQSSNGGGSLVISDGGVPRPVSGTFNFGAQASSGDPSSYRVTLSSAEFNNDRSLYFVNFSTQNFTNGAGGFHVNFYYNTEPTSTTNKSFSGSSPFVTNTGSAPQNAASICGIVARPDNTAILNTGNCVPLPTIDTTQNRVPLTSADIFPLRFSCTRGPQNSLTVCRFTLPPDRSIPEGFGVGIGNADPRSCNLIGTIAQCENIPTGQGRGNVSIFAYFGNQAIATGETVLIQGAAVNSGDDDNNGGGSSGGGSQNDDDDDSNNDIEEEDTGNISDEEGVITVTIDRDSNNGGQVPLTDPTTDPIRDPVPINDGNNDDGDQNEPDENSDGADSQDGNAFINPEDLVNTGGLTFFIVSGLSALVILSIFSASLNRNSLKNSSFK